MREIEINGRKIGDNSPCFIIAEAGVNHNGKLELALELVEIAKAAGADAVKFQLFRPEEQVSIAARPAAYQQERSGFDNMLQMGKSYDLPWEEHRTIAAYCRKLGIIYLASCFDRLAVNFLIGLGGEAVKVGSGEITNYPLLAYISSTGLPILLSTGASTLRDVAGAVEHINQNGSSPIILLHCVSNYPADPAALNIRAMQTMARAFGALKGFSDHTSGWIAAPVAVALGACVIEKHFTLDKNLPGPDHAASLDPAGLRDFVAVIRTAEACLGDGVKHLLEEEKPIRTASRRSLVSYSHITAGSRLDEHNTTFKRPATGIDPRLWETVRGRTVKSSVPPDTPIKWEMLV
ncbi:MAG: N-acetylneuraminate synthase family protein [Syntrophomonas sp.]